MEKEKKKKKSFIDEYQAELIVILILFVLAWVFVAPYIFINSDSSAFKDTGVIGDTIGGITAPAIGLLSAILIYFSFRAQIKANKKLNKQIEKAHAENNFVFANQEWEKLIGKVEEDGVFNLMLKAQSIRTTFEMLQEANFYQQIEQKDVFDCIGEAYVLNKSVRLHILYFRIIGGLDLDDAHEESLWEKIAFYYEYEYEMIITNVELIILANKQFFKKDEMSLLSGTAKLKENTKILKGIFEGIKKDVVNRFKEEDKKIK